MPAPEEAFGYKPAGIQSDLKLIVDAAREAGRIAMQYFGKDPKVWVKDGVSPVSEADYAANAYLQETLQTARPGYGWLSEENPDDGERLKKDRVFIVDPIDGTRGFIAGSSKWCVSVAVVEHGRPICGVLECPALEETYTASRNGGAKLNGKNIFRIEVSSGGLMAGPKALVRRYATESEFDIEIAPFIPSLAYRLAMVANGELFGNYARANCHDWDVVAADLILEEAGASLLRLDGSKIVYNRASTTHGILAAAANDMVEQLLHIAGLESDIEIRDGN